MLSIKALANPLKADPDPDPDPSSTVFYSASKKLSERRRTQHNNFYTSTISILPIYMEQRHMVNQYDALILRVQLGTKTAGKHGIDIIDYTYQKYQI